MTHIGWTTRRRGPLRSWLAACWRSRSSSCSPRATSTTRSRGLPELFISPLGHRDARALLESVLPAPLDEPVLERIVAETRGNPLALLELPRGLTPTELAGGFGLPRRCPCLPASRRASRGDWRVFQTMSVACCSWRRPTRSAIRRSCGGRRSDSESQSRLPTWSSRKTCWFLVRGWCSVIRWFVRLSTGQPRPSERREAHRALAEATDPELDPDRRAWHRAQAAQKPDEEVAAELEESAARAQARGGYAAAAAFLERATALTPEESQRSGRALAAAQAKLQAGALDDALRLVATAEAGVLSESEQARAGLLRGQIAFLATRSGDAAALLLKAAERLRELDPELARETYLEALTAAIFAGPLAGPGASPHEIAEAASSAPRARKPRGPDLLLDGLVAILSDLYRVAVPTSAPSAARD